MTDEKEGSSGVEGLAKTRTYGKFRCHNPSCMARITVQPGAKHVTGAGQYNHARAGIGRQLCLCGQQTVYDIAVYRVALVWSVQRDRHHTAIRFHDYRIRHLPILQEKRCTYVDIYTMTMSQYSRATEQCHRCGHRGKSRQ